MMQIAHLKSRSLLLVSGADAEHFLQNLITCDIEGLQVGGLTFGALLTPQGKILFDFFVQRTQAGFLIDVATDQREALAKRLTFYKLRADVLIEPDETPVFASWPGTQSGNADPRLGILGERRFGGELETNSTEDDWNRLRITLGVPHSGFDFPLGELFPHEAMMDQFERGGVDFSKGCYVGQEVVSRMQHRGTARNRFVLVEAVEELSDQGSELVAGERSIGTLGSSSGNHGLAIVRLDRARKAMNDGVPIACNEVPLTLSLPDYVNFGWPE